MRILLDVDGVLADLVSHLQETAGITSEVNTYDFRDCLTDLELLQVQQASGQRGFCLGIPWYPGAKEFLDDLHQMGQVYAVTAPWHLDTWAHERREWLAGRVDSTRVLSVPGVSKHLVRGDLLIEDDSHTCRTWLRENPDGHAVLIDRPYNRTREVQPRMFRAHGYAEALRLADGIGKVLQMNDDERITLAQKAYVAGLRYAAEAFSGGTKVSDLLTLAREIEGLTPEEIEAL